MEPDNKPRRLYFDTYIAMIREAPGTKMFRHFYLEAGDGTKFDATGDGSNSCAFFVSSALLLFGKVKGVHGTVASTIRDLEESGWEEAKEMKAGDVLAWEPREYEDGEHGHVGFYLGNDMAVSTSSSEKRVSEHRVDFGDEKRAVIKIFRMNAW